MSLSANEMSTNRTTWIYEGVWGVLTSVFCVPRHAPDLPTIDAEQISSRKPSTRYISYLTFQLLLLLVVIAVPSVGGSIALAVAESQWFFAGTIAIVIVLLSIAVISYLAIHLRYDTTWYVFSDRSMRLRRGIWVIHESTITFENIQNVKVMQGPLQRWFGIADVVVETAGGGGSSQESGGGYGSHAGVIEGVAEASQIRDAIMNRANLSQTTGLGDESDEPNALHRNWSPAHIELLAEIRDFANLAAR